MVHRITAKLIPKTYVAVDTSVLFAKDKSIVVNEKFQELIHSFENKSDIKYCIPDVVKKELIYQQKKHALKSLAQCKEALNSIYDMFGKPKRTPYTEKEIINLTLKRFEKWAKKNKIEILETPIDKIDWEKLIINAVDRVPPFEDSEGKREKGFRDAMIMHTILNLPNHIKEEETSIAFICNDRLLRESTAQKFEPKSRLLVFENIDEFSSYLRLKLEKLSEGFIKNITKRARLKFLNPARSGLFDKENLREMIKNKFTEAFNTPSGDSRTSYKERDEGQFWIRNPSFVEINEDGYFVWESIVIHRQYYREIKFPALGQLALRHLSAAMGMHGHEQKSSGLTPMIDLFKSSLSLSEENAGIKPAYDTEFDIASYYLTQDFVERDRLYERFFKVIWSSKVASNGRFSQIQILEIQFINKDFEEIESR